MPPQVPARKAPNAKLGLLLLVCALLTGLAVGYILGRSTLSAGTVLPPQTPENEGATLSGEVPGSEIPSPPPEAVDLSPQQDVVEDLPVADETVPPEGQPGAEAAEPLVEPSPPPAN